MQGSIIYIGDCLSVLKRLPDASVQTCITSPPYWGLRDYGDPDQLGLEDTPQAYIEKTVAIFRQVRRVLNDDGTLWLNLGDSYAKRNLPGGLKRKDLIGIPWRVALALQEDGWWLRSDIVWAKPTAMPENIGDRPTRSHEFIFLLSKSDRYYYDAEAIKEPDCGIPAGNNFRRDHRISHGTGSDKRWRPGQGRNKRDVWTIASRPFKGAHFAVFPLELPYICIQAATREGDLVLDPFAGAGTVGVVAARTGRRFVGIELNPEYAEMARTRILDAPMSLFQFEGKEATDEV